MKIWTAHEKPHASPILLREGFSFGGFFFGPFWLIAQGAWLPALGVFALSLAIVLLSEPPASVVLFTGLAFLLGLTGRDLVRWTVRRRGYLESNVVAARDEDEAHARLLEARPDLVERSMAAETAP